LRPGAAAADDCRQAARVLWSALRGIASLALAQKPELSTQRSAAEMADELVAADLAGLQANPPV
jgi:hypothetical protein